MSNSECLTSITKCYTGHRNYTMFSRPIEITVSDFGIEIGETKTLELRTYSLESTNFWTSGTGIR